MILYERVCELFEYTTCGNLVRKMTVSPNAMCGEVAGCTLQDGYRAVGIDGGIYKVHKIVWLLHNKYYPDHMIDHINGIRDDNRIENLRVADVVKNAYNQSKPVNNTSGYRGVSYDKSRKPLNKWRALCSVNGKRYNPGYFMTPVEAHNALVEFRNMHHGEFANNE